MKDCKNCVHEKGGMICLQGHVRRLKYENLQSVGHFPLDDCHAWKEKVECWWCRDWEKFETTGSYWTNSSTLEVVKKLIGLSPDKPECPICSKKL